MSGSVSRLNIAVRGVVLLLLVVVIGVGLYQRWDERGVFWLLDESQFTPEQQAASIGLSNYHVVVAGKPIAGLERDETSGLTYNPRTNTLFTVLGKRAEIIELSLDGNVLRRIKVKGLKNPEGIEVFSGDLMGIIDERKRSLTIFPLTADTQEIDAAQHLTVDLGFDDAGNKGFEGLGWDSRKQLVLLGKERDPRGFFTLPLPTQSGPVQGLVEHNIDDVFVRDISSVSYDARTGHILMLSDESRVLVELDADFKPRSFISLAVGMNGLGRGIKQPEGVTIDAAGNIYLVSEPNMFYALSKATDVGQ